MHYINSMHGEIYGIDHNMKRFQFDQAMKARAKTPIPGLYLTGEGNFKRKNMLHIFYDLGAEKMNRQHLKIRKFWGKN